MQQKWNVLLCLVEESFW